MYPLSNQALRKKSENSAVFCAVDHADGELLELSLQFRGIDNQEHTNRDAWHHGPADKRRERSVSSTNSHQHATAGTPGRIRNDPDS